MIEPSESSDAPGAAGATVRLDATNLRGIAHPVRMRMLGLLRADGSATATMLAGQLGLNTGATSYHLRQLAAHGFITEETGRGTGRERWWRAAHWSTTWEESTVADPEGLGTVFLRSVAEVYAERMMRAVDESPTLPADWQGTREFSDYLLRLTPAEQRAMLEEVREVLRRYRTADPDVAAAAPAGAEQVVFQFQTFLRPGTIEPDAVEPDAVEPDAVEPDAVEPDAESGDE